MMNLHISAPSVFIDTFYKNLVSLNLAGNNKIVLRSEKKHDQFESARFDSAEFKKIVGSTSQYDKIFIHQFSPLMYPWVARNEFKELNWMVWGADLYNLPGLEDEFYEPITQAYHRSDWNTPDLLYKLKVFLTAQRFKKAAYGKVDHILTWMNEEFSFAKKMLPLPKASHQFFFYENSTPYQQLVNLRPVENKRDHALPVFILGNSATKANNHADVFEYLQRNSVRVKLIVPVSYGDKKYISFLKKKTGSLEPETVEFMESFMSFEEYTRFLQSTDGLIMNTIRPQGYGNIFMMMSLGKPVYMNAHNISLPDLTAHGIECNSLKDLATMKASRPSSAEAVVNLLSREKLIVTYQKLFS